jgi:protein tyrosine phosphatase
MKSEQAVDVLQIVKSLRNQRQRSVQTEAQVQFNLQLTNYTILVRVHLQRREEHLAHA